MGKCSQNGHVLAFPLQQWAIFKQLAKSYKGVVVFGHSIILGLLEVKTDLGFYPQIYPLLKANGSWQECHV